MSRITYKSEGVGGMNTKQIAIHHTAVSRESNFRQLAAVDKYHKGKWNMKSTLGWYVGYNFFIDTDGSLTQTRAIGEETMANKGHNCDVEERCDTISVCLTGDFNRELPSDKQIEALKGFIEDFNFLYSDIKTVLHRGIQTNRTCPGGLFTKQYLDIRILNKGETHSDITKKIELSTIIEELGFLETQLKRLLAKLKKVWYNIV